MAAADDPLDWSIDQVVEALCTSTQWWREGRPNSILPDPASFEHTLREQEVNGFALLTYLTDQTLKDDFGIKSIGRRAALSWAIDKLREQSPKYGEHLGAQQSAFLAGSVAQSMMGHARARVYPWLGNTPAPSEMIRPGLATPAHEAALPAIVEDSETTENVAGAPAKRLGETMIEDATGKKRRKLTLVEPSAGKLTNSFTKPAPAVSMLSSRKKFPVDRIFYDNAPFGQVLEEDDDLGMEHCGEVDDTIGPYVYRQFRHFLRNPEREEIVRDGQRAVVVYPYRSNILSANSPRSATVLRIDARGLQATRQDTRRLLNAMPYDENSKGGHDDWDFIAEKWNKPDSEVLPLFGDSETEDEDSSSYAAELEAEEKERELNELRKQQLSKEDVSRIIDNRIQELVEIWKRKKLPGCERTARTVWRKGVRSKHRALLRVVAREKVQTIEKRLNKLKEAMVDEIWHKEAEVRRQCATLDQSVFDREEELWKISVWERRVEPPRVSTTAMPRRPKKKASQVDGDAGDWVDSDSEMASDGFDDFLDIDQDIKEDSPVIGRAPSEELGEPYDASAPAEDETSLSERLEDEDSFVPITSPEPEVALPVTPNQTRTAKKILDNRSTVQVPQPGSAHSIVDLTMLSDSSSPTPLAKRSKPKVSDPVSKNSQPPASRFGGDPENSAYDDIVSWSYAELQERGDKKRLILKILRTSIGSKEYRDIRAYFTGLTQGKMRDQLWKAMRAIGRNERLPGLSDKDWEVLVKLSRLYACWNKVRQKYWSNALDKLAVVLGRIIDQSDTPQSKRDSDAFFNFVSSILHRFMNPKSDHRSSDEMPEVSDDEVADILPEDTPHKKRKRKVQKSASAFNLRRSARKRLEAQEERERRLRERVGSSQTQASDSLIVNPSEDGGLGPIFINDKIGLRIKSHQVDGVKFMWREVVEAGRTDPQGCLLAHTMGLGKTMQAITLMVTIAEAANSPDQSVKSQIPEELQQLRNLVLCPASLVLNWVTELDDWIPESASEKIGRIRHITAEHKPQERVNTVRRWHKRGGILVISYEMLRGLFNDKQAARLTNAERDTMRDGLLKGATLIIADEAHRMKNATSSLRQIVEQFDSKSRVALTGSPLANNLVEYWSMIDWISPGYLGSLKEFKAHFVEPIEEGLYKESTPIEHRKALKKLRVLKNEIDPKVHRADISVLRADLKAKVEFLITVPLTDLQKDLYKLCVRQLMARRKDNVSNSRMWQWIHILTSLCNHPAAFLKSIQDRQAQGAGKEQTTDEDDSTDQHELPHGDLDLAPKTVLSPALIQEAEEVFSKAQNLNSPHHSFKTQILMGILKTAKDAGDQVLVFSQHISTLNYLEDLLKNQKQQFVRLDGKTKMADRPHILEKFNAGEYDVFLISTRAGGTGFNMPRANRVVIFDFGFNPQNEEQAIGRAYRIGQEKEVFVYRMVAGGTFEPKVWNRALFKTQLASRVVDTKNPERHAEKLKDYFFDPKPVDQEDLTEHEGKDRDVLDKILAKRDRGKDTGIRAITTTETLMAEDHDAALNDQEKEEVKKMIEAERLRKEDPKAWEQYLRDNPGLDDKHALRTLQSDFLGEAAKKNPQAPYSLGQGFSYSQPTFLPPAVARALSGSGVPPSSAPPVSAFIPQAPPFPSAAAPDLSQGGSPERAKLAGIRSSGAGVNNAGPSFPNRKAPSPLPAISQPHLDEQRGEPAEPEPMAERGPFVSSTAIRHNRSPRDVNLTNRSKTSPPNQEVPRPKIGLRAESAATTFPERAGNKRHSSQRSTQISSASQAKTKTYIALSSDDSGDD